MSRIAALSLLMLLAAFALPAAAAEVYKCTGADGKTYYSGQKCPAGADGEKLHVQRPATSDEPAPTEKRKSLDEQIAEATDPVAKARLQIQKQECDLAATQLERYEGAPYLVEQQEDGTQRRLSDEETAAEKARLRGRIESQCR